MSQTTCTEDAVANLVQFYEALAPTDLPRLSTIYSEDAFFKDPFNEVRGVPAIQGVFEHMFANLQAPRFCVTDRVVQDRQAFLGWTFRLHLKRWPRLAPLQVQGGSFLRFDDRGRVIWHRDYWDPNEELYAKLPGLGVFFRWLQKQGGAASAKT